MATLALYAIVLTVAVYVPAFVFFEEQFGFGDIDFDIGTDETCTNWFTCLIDGTVGVVTGIIEFLIAAFNLATLGVFVGEDAIGIDRTLRFFLLLVLTLMWGLIVVGQVRGSAQG